jgi:biotin-dependent carboxylase-like uncharacterized protein
MTSLRVTSPGWASSVQDAGRPGLAALGVPPSGALDEPQRQLLNRLVGNHDDAAVVETLGGLHVEATGPALVATSGEHAAVSIRTGDVVAVQPVAGELWGYLAVRGGIAVRPVLGSRSLDSRSRLGPPPIAAGTLLPIGPDPGTPVVVDVAPARPRGDVAVAVWRGPRADWFVDDALETLTRCPWTVTGDASRVGVRLSGEPLRRRRDSELASEGVITGAVQVPPDGQPVVMLADHPTTGGYPVLAVVDVASLPTLVQSRPGGTVRFRAL